MKRVTGTTLAILALAVTGRAALYDVSWTGAAGTSSWTTAGNWTPNDTLGTSGPVNGTHTYNVTIDSAGAAVSLNVSNAATNQITLGGSNDVTLTTNGGNNAHTTNRVDVLGASTLNISFNAGWRMKGKGGSDVVQLNFSDTAKIQGTGKLIFWDVQAIQGGTYDINVDVGNDFGDGTGHRFNLAGPVTVGRYNAINRNLAITTASSTSHSIQNLYTNDHDLSVAGNLSLAEYDKRGDAGSQSSYAVLRAGASTIAVGGDLSINSDPNGVNQSGTAQKRDSMIIAGAARFELSGSFATNRASDLWYDGTGRIETTQRWNTREAAFAFVGGGSEAAPKLFEVMSQDQGAVEAGWQGPFTMGSLEVTGNTYLKLQDLYDNSRADALPEALYVQNVVVASGSTLDLNGLCVYYSGSALIEGDVRNGLLITVPEPATMALLGCVVLCTLARRHRAR